MNINYFLPTRIVSGKGCVVNNKALFLKAGKRCLIVTGKHSAKLSGALDDAIAVLESLGIEYTVFDSIGENPQTEICLQAGSVAHEFNADFVLGIGGGSVLDASKAIAIYALYPDIGHEDIYVRTVPANHLPVYLIGTTAGTGSEVTGVSVLTNSRTGLKKSISGADCYAEVSFCDYSYTISANTNVRISTALDAFAHAVEAYLSDADNKFVDLFALKAIEMLKPFIVDKKFEGLTEADYEALYIASIYAGLAINQAGTCFPHTVGYYLTETFGVSHGRACAVLMPELLLRAKKYCPDKLGAITDILGFDEIALSATVKELADVRVTFTSEDADSIAQRWKNGVKNFDRSPGGFSWIDARNALMKITF